MASSSYSRAVTVAAMQAVFNSAWIAARELSPAKRRLARVGVIAIGAAGYAGATPDTRRAIREVRAEVESLRDKEDEPESSRDSAEEPPATPDSSFDKRRAVAIVGALGLTIAVTLGRRRLEKRWLARLARDGHAHPTRALALRMAPVAFAAELAIQIIDMHTLPDKTD
ncbi:hypothetical protein [Paractinoplanes hotanensis]|uniref:DUF4235 domain-containing protein n=1 Tax=Paractinoplanes hotanensis TaxID=2906497 RepID=A0ABT0YGX5_9ACTN|nr:hypothetical protein [Actinoplanes hotanensis]MCM4085005.1 hypothetical protein [Actinoplanes hotanensis]